MTNDQSNAKGIKFVIPMTYEIKLPQFEGPFDLLLFFIERDELDISNIPIASIANDFLAYLQQMDTLNIEVASEFIVVAATLMRIKAKMLLPRKELDETGKEIDPRQELVQKLLEYKQYKSIIGELKAFEEERAKMLKRGNLEQEFKLVAAKYATDLDMQSVTLFKLMRAFEKAMERLDRNNKKPVHSVVTYAYTLEGQREFLLDYLKKEKRVSFEKLFSNFNNKIQAIFTFLAMLELVQQQSFRLQVGLGINNFWVEEVA